MNAVDVVQEIVVITVDSGAAKSVWPIRKKGVARTQATRTVRLAAASGSPIHVEGDARLEIVRNDKKCIMKFLDADVIRPLASVSAIVDEGNIVATRPQESYTSIGQKIPMSRRDKRVCGAVGRTRGFENGENGEVRQVEHGWASVNQNVEENRERCKTKTEKKGSMRD